MNKVNNRVPQLLKKIVYNGCEIVKYHSTTTNKMHYAVVESMLAAKFDIYTDKGGLNVDLDSVSQFIVTEDKEIAHNLFSDSVKDQMIREIDPFINADKGKE